MHISVIGGGVIGLSTAVQDFKINQGKHLSIYRCGYGPALGGTAPCYANK